MTLPNCFYFYSKTHALYFEYVHVALRNSMLFIIQFYEMNFWRKYLQNQTVKKIVQ